MVEQVRLVFWVFHATCDELAQFNLYSVHEPGFDGRSLSRAGKKFLPRWRYPRQRVVGCTPPVDTIRSGIGEAARLSIHAARPEQPVMMVCRRPHLLMRGRSDETPRHLGFPLRNFPGTIRQRGCCVNYIIARKLLAACASRGSVRNIPGNSSAAGIYTNSRTIRPRPSWWRRERPQLVQASKHESGCRLS